jgi:hypothetical protein
MDFMNLVQNVDTAELVDMTDIQVGGGKSRGLLPTGTAFVRLSGYVEYGNHQQEFNGKKKDPALEFRLIFTVVGGVGVNLAGEDENFVGEDGYCPTIQTFDTAQTRYDKSRAVAYFNAVNVAPKGTHFIQKLGQLYTLQIGVKKNKKTGKDMQDIDFSNLQPAVDPATRRPYTTYADKDGELKPIVELEQSNIRVFLWDKPSTISMEQYKAMWDSIEIQGEWAEKKDESGKVLEKAKSKNFMQIKCRNALNFAGSSLENLLLSNGISMDSLEAAEHEDGTTEVEEAQETTESTETISAPPADDTITPPPAE